METEAQLHERLLGTLFGEGWQTRQIVGDDERINALAVTLASVIAIHPDAETPDDVKAMARAVAETIETSALAIARDIAEAEAG